MYLARIVEEHSKQEHCCWVDAPNFIEALKQVAESLAQQGFVVKSAHSYLEVTYRSGERKAQVFVSLLPALPQLDHEPLAMALTSHPMVSIFDHQPQTQRPSHQTM